MTKGDLKRKRLLKAFGAHLEALIYQNFKNKSEFLAKSGIHKATLHDITTGKADPQLTTLHVLAKEIGIPLRDLFPSE